MGFLGERERGVREGVSARQTKKQKQWSDSSSPLSSSSPRHRFSRFPMSHRGGQRTRRGHRGIGRRARRQEIGPEPPDAQLGGLCDERRDEQAGGDVEGVVEHREGSCRGGRRGRRSPLARGNEFDRGGGDKPLSNWNEERHQRGYGIGTIRVRDRRVVDVKGPLPWFSSCLEHNERKHGDGDDGEGLEPREVARDEAPVDRGEGRRESRLAAVGSVVRRCRR